MFINVGYVVGLLPVTGLQLPLISAGGTSTATTLFMIGFIANAEVFGVRGVDGNVEVIASTQDEWSTRVEPSVGSVSSRQ